MARRRYHQPSIVGITSVLLLMAPFCECLVPPPLHLPGRVGSARLRSFAPPPSPAGDDMTDEEVDEFLFGDESAAAAAVSAIGPEPTGSSTDMPPPAAPRSSPKTEETVALVGSPTAGKSSLLNLNALKRNLIQRTIRDNKSDILRMISSPSASDEASLADRLETLVSAGAVTLLTDSNLLDGGWTLVRRGAGEDGDPRPFRRFPLLTRRRTVHLESVGEAPHVEDTRTWPRWCPLSYSRRRNIVRLTRKSMELDAGLRRWSVGPMRWEIEGGGGDEFAVRVLYVDDDLCISDEAPIGEGTAAEGRSARSPDRWTVHTRDEAWAGGDRVRFRSLLRRVLRGRRRSVTEITSDPDSGTATARALLIGGRDEVEGATATTFSWDASGDPWAHLGADERQATLSKITIAEIERAVADHAKIVEEQRRRPGKFRGPAGKKL